MWWGSRGLGEAEFEAVAVFLDRGIKIAAEARKRISLSPVLVV